MFVFIATVDWVKDFIIILISFHWTWFRFFPYNLPILLFFLLKIVLIFNKLRYFPLIFDFWIATLFEMYSSCHSFGLYRFFHFVDTLIAIAASLIGVLWVWCSIVHFRKLIFLSEVRFQCLFSEDFRSNFKVLAIFF